VSAGIVEISLGIELDGSADLEWLRDFGISGRISLPNKYLREGPKSQREFHA
jgi:hypothetical protein